MVRRRLLKFKRARHANIWPINEDANKPPIGWKGWPDNKKFALILTHDVETAGGQEKCRRLLALEQQLGFKSSFNFVPEKYEVSSKLRNHLVENGFEVGVHGLNHDGKLYSSEKIFKQRAVRINHYLKDWQSVGFRSPAMHNNLNWIHELNIEYDASTFDTDPFEPQSDGVGIIFPFWVSGKNGRTGYVELPYTLAQDFTLFILMKEKDISIWKQKVDWLAKNSGLALFNTHPDYMNFEEQDLKSEEYPSTHYAEILRYIKSKYEEQYWHVLPKEISEFWEKNFSGK